jgi:hypothetical protein
MIKLLSELVYFLSAVIARNEAIQRISKQNSMLFILKTGLLCRYAPRNDYKLTI